MTLYHTDVSRFICLNSLSIIYYFFQDKKSPVKSLHESMQGIIPGDII